MKNYPKTDDEIAVWNQYISTKEIYPMELLVNKNSEKYIGLQKNDIIYVKVLNTQVEFGSDKVLVSAIFLGKV